MPDAERSACFFVDCMGFRLLPVQDPGWRFVARDGVMIMLGSCPDAVHPRDLGDHSCFAYLAADDVDACYREFTAAGVETMAGPADKPWRMREFPLRTVDGHRIMVEEGVDG